MSAHRRHRGLAYIEAVLATVMVAVLLAPALQALSSGLMGQQVANDQSTQALSLQSKLDEVLAKPYSVLFAQTQASGGNTPTSISLALSDPPGSSRRLVTIYRTNGSGATATDTGLLRIRVAWEGAPSESGLVALRSKWL
jgi:hypothetical protein